MKIVYMGTPEFAVPPLRSLIESPDHQVIGVVTQPDRVKGRGKRILPPPVKVLTEEMNIPVFQPETLKNNHDFLGILEELSPEIIVVAAYGRILPKEILELPTYGCINIHGSLLPKYRGASPIQSSILMGEEITGVTIMQMAEGLDTGDMLTKSSIPLDNMYYPTLSDKLSKLGGELLLEVLPKIQEGEIEPEKQDESLATYTGMITKHDGKIDFNHKSASEIERMIRAYEPWPGAYAYLGEDNLIKFKAGHPLSLEDIKETKDYNPGTIVKADNTGIYIRTEMDIFCLTELQIPGKNWMDSGSYLRGHKLEVGEIFR